MGVARAYVVGSPYNGGQIGQIDYEQTTNTMYLAHLNRPPHKLIRNSHVDWEFEQIAFGPSIDAPDNVSAANTTPNTDSENSGANYFPQPATYVVTAVNDETGEESRASSSDSATNDLTLKRNYNTISWDAVTGATRYNVYKADNNQFYGYIGTTEDLTFRDDNIGPALDRAPPAAENPFTGSSNYPSVVALHDQRLLWARTRNAPNGVFASRLGVNQLENMDRSRPARADDALSFAILAKKANPVNSLHAGTSLLALTTHGIFSISGDGQGGAISGTSPPSTPMAIGRGASRLKPQGVDNVVFYTPSAGASVRAIGYSFELDGIKSNDVSIFSPHFFEGHEIVDWAYAQEPRSILWAVRDDGALLAFAWEQEQNVWGWTLCDLGGGIAKSCAAIHESGEDRLYLVVERGERTFIERMAPFVWEDVSETCYTACSVAGTFDPPQSSFTGLWHLEGQEVAVRADDQFLTGLTVENGTVTLPDTASEASSVAIGLPYEVQIDTLPVRFSGQAGSNLGRTQQTADIVLQLRRTGPLTAGPTGTRQQIVRMRTSEAYDEAVALFSGTTQPIATENLVSKDVCVSVRQTLPAPFELLAVAVEPVVGG